MKECFKCKRHLPLEDYYKHPQMGDGHLNKCKDCTKSDSEKRRKIKEKDPEWVLSERNRHREKTRRYVQQGRQSKLSSSKKLECTKKYRNENPEKYAAHGIVARALRSGKINRHPCCICGSKAQAHHEDYSKPLDVIWFCPKHHNEHHAKKRDKEIMKSLNQETI